MSLALLRQQLADVIDGTRSATPGLSTGATALDAALPGGGLPRGRLTEMVGAPGSGKTTIDRKSTRLNSSHMSESRMPSSA